MPFKAILCTSMFFGACCAEEISPFKFTDHLPVYEIPASSRFVTQDGVIYYFSAPKEGSYPIAILCGGSSSKGCIYSIIHVHRYLLEEFLELNVGVLTVEQKGVDGNQVDETIFFEHYTRSERLQDHCAVIRDLKANPPAGWNGKLVFLGVSEGGPIVTRLTEEHADCTLATINWSGAGDWSWREELWCFLMANPPCPHQLPLQSCENCWNQVFPRDRFDAIMDGTLQDPNVEREFLGMTYRYHADAQTFPPINYAALRTPYLVVAGTLDSLIQSSDAFVEKSHATYLRVEGMDHYVRKRPDVVAQSFQWLQEQLDGGQDEGI